MASENLVEWTLNINQNVYDSASQVFKAWDTTVEEMLMFYSSLCDQQDVQQV